MAPSHGNTRSEAAKMEQIITEFCAKSLRMVQFSIEGSPAALENFDLWRQSNLEPIMVDVILEQGSIDWETLSPKRNLRRNLPSKERYPHC
ncbi:hypothetical protein SLEP1_g34675 [Rubroshorea leprosula]|uniref:Uncharacterized protein n=1 Tax=Rubroshorea leprosula TaxID=152421 RepID=A0AAV5KKQ9_9ROSI|nr:hypothetical protein SLEP1_g34675 [Rubroshorea leprosula]